MTSSYSAPFVPWLGTMEVAGPRLYGPRACGADRGKGDAELGRDLLQGQPLPSSDVTYLTVVVTGVSCWVAAQLLLAGLSGFTCCVTYRVLSIRVGTYFGVSPSPHRHALLVNRRGCRVILGFRGRYIQWYHQVCLVIRRKLMEPARPKGLVLVLVLRFLLFGSPGCSAGL